MCKENVPILSHLITIQMPEFKYKHELSLLIPTNNYNTIQLFGDICCVFVFMKYVSNFFTKLKSMNLAVETVAKTNV